MGKKAREYKAGDFIFAKVKGYPAWPARVRGINGKKYFVYFYGTGEIANLPPNMIFDYAENKSKFLTKTVKRKDFNDGVRQIEHDFLNNVPLEEVAGLTPIEIPAPTTNDVSNDTINADDTMNETTETSTSDEPMNTSQNETAVEDSDEGGALVIDEGKKGRKAKGESTPKVVKTVKELKAMKNQKNVAKKDEKEKEEEMKKEEEIISRSGRKIRPKRYADEQTEDNTALPTPTAKKRRGASPEKKTDTPVAVPEPPVAKTYRAVSQMEIEDLKEPFTPSYKSEPRSIAVLKLKAEEDTKSKARTEPLLRTRSGLKPNAELEL
ncbi:Hepatoma-derived growth factor-related protein 3 [Eumeta japonica]|uniref:Hepatoma-derived growth factor-related protein 3 n=1 Tax=Eumeta variegata TaxID=151549 RepID=A0A4C1TNW2_EUMVA|nr:Hepatoma-derived growth factor-related protein 3 [Eumeta japonica]